MIFLQCHRGMFPQRYQNAAVLTDRFKLILYPNTFENRDLITSKEHPVMELYDIPADPREEKNLADRYPEIADSLKRAYDWWFDDVKRSRNFAPGRIPLGADAENPTYLCRYQDATYMDRKPAGWPVVIERAGPYRISVNRGASSGRGYINVQYDTVILEHPLTGSENEAVFDLPAGTFNLNVWFREEGKEYKPRPDEDLIGDVWVKCLKD